MSARREIRPSLARRALWIVRDVLFVVADGLLLAFVRPSVPRLPKDKPKVAVIAAHGIGDLVLLMPALDALLRRYPRSRFAITLVASSAAAAFAASLVSVDEVVQVDRVKLRRNLAYRLAILRGMRRAGFSIAVQPNFNRDLLVEDSLMRATGAATRIGSVGTPMFMGSWARLLGNRWYSQLIPASPGLLHESTRNAELVCRLDPDSPAPQGSAWRASIPRPTRASPEEPPYALFVVGASSPLKTWPLAHFEWVARAIRARADLPVVICAGSDDEVQRTNVAPAGDARLRYRIGASDPSEFMALIAGARLVVSNDSAAAHIAAALRVPSVCVVGGGIVGRYHPYPPGRDGEATTPVAVGLSSPMPCFDCGWRCRFRLQGGQPAPCVDGVEPARVLAAALELLQRPSGP